MTDHSDNRNAIIAALREELVGPAPGGTAVDTRGKLVFEKREDSYGPWKQSRSGEEILTRVAPAKRYGIGVLYPPGVGQTAEPPSGGSDDDPSPPGDLGAEPGAPGSTAEESIRLISQREDRRRGMVADSDDFDLSDANAMKPCVIGVTFFAELPAGSRLVVSVPSTHPLLGVAVNGRYTPKDVEVARGKLRTQGSVAADQQSAAQQDPGQAETGFMNDRWWLRRPVTGRAEYEAETILAADGEAVAPASEPVWEGAEGLSLRVQLRARKAGEGRSLVTVCLRNDTRLPRGSLHEQCLFQTYFDCVVQAPGGSPHVLPYPDRGAEDDPGSEEASLALMYRHAKTFAVGHACAADWDREGGTGDRASRVRGECLPVWRANRVTPDIGWPEHKDSLAVPMAPLAGLDGADDGLAAAARVVNSYLSWIDRRAAEARSSLGGAQLATAETHLEQCRECAARMKAGLDLLGAGGRVRRAFTLANHAILLQQTAANRPVRTRSYDARARRYEYSSPLVPPSNWSRSGAWRPFQIAFILMNLESLSSAESDTRTNVELLWFPTGGGKTEAYLGLIAFTLFYLRLESTAAGPSADRHGVEALMRYTLRLLTAQQFERASSLICAMEYLRGEHEDELGPDTFSIGIWLGGSTTPNRREDARTALSALLRNPKSENPFLLIRCPWCGAEMGPSRHSRGRSGPAGRVTGVPGYERRADTVALTCPDHGCKFSGQLPVYVIDEDIYDVRPSLLIGTVDKFAMLAWRPKARAIFGLGPDGGRENNPPGLIVQDELHLISGPLGSMYGLYEPVIEELLSAIK